MSGRESERRRIIAGQNGDGVFKLRAALSERRGFRFGRGEFGFGARDIEVVADAAIETAADELDLFFAQIHGAVHGGDFRIQRANGKIIFRHVRLKRQQHAIKSGERRLRIGAGAFKTAAHPAPQIHFVTQVQRHAERIRGDVAETRVLVRRKTLARETRVEIQARQEFTARDSRGGSRLVDARDGRFQVLIRTAAPVIPVHSVFRR